MNDFRIGPTLVGKTALVTGSSRGIGRAIAILFADRGARVLLHGRDHKALSEVRNAIQSAGGLAHEFVADLVQPGEVDALGVAIHSEHGIPDIVVANAGGSPGRPGPLEQTDLDDWRNAIDANLTATFLTLRTFLPGMKESGHGTVVTVSSTAARRAGSGAPLAYAAAKAGIQSLTREAAIQAGPYGVRVNCLAPETILTERNQEQIPDRAQQTLAEMHPLQRLGTPQDVARAALFLVSAEASWITGVTLDLSGGAVVI